MGRPPRLAVNRPDCYFRILVIGVWLFALRLASPEPEPRPKPAGYELEWDAPADCPDIAAVEARVAELAPAPEGGSGLMSLRGEVRRTRARYVLRLRTEFLGGVDERVVESDNCADLGETTALFVAVALEPILGDGRDAAPMPTQPPALVPRPPPEAPEAPDSAEARSEDVARSPSHPTPPPRRVPPPATDSRPGTFALRLGPQLELGSLPAVTGGPNLAAGLIWPRWRAELFGHYLLPRGADGPEPSSGRVQLGAAGVRGCYRLSGGPVEFPLCAFVEAGALRVDSEGLEPQNTLHFAWMAPGLGAAVAVGGRRVGFFGGLEGAVSTLRSQVFVGDQRIFRTGSVSVRALLGMEIFFAIQRG